MGVRGVYVSRGWGQEPTRLTSVPPLWLAQCLRDVCGVQQNDETNSRGVLKGESEPLKKKVMMVLVLGPPGCPMVISSGMQSMDTMKQVYQIVKPLNPNFCFLQCTSAYPLQPEDVNLRVISVSPREGPCLIGPFAVGKMQPKF